MIRQKRIGNTIVEINTHDSSDMKDAIPNNVRAYDSELNPIWDIVDLLKDYSDTNNLKYLEELYFEIRDIDEDTIRLISFYNHCEISLSERKIIRIINNR